MKGSEAKMTAFMEGADKRYVIPVYQRKYDWREANCLQLYSDLKKIVLDKRGSHFFGSIVSSVVPKGSKIEYHIIDGQQRLTTITLLLLAIRNLVSKGKLHPRENRLDEQINQRFLTSPWATDPDDRIKLRPVKGDRGALESLFGADSGTYPEASNLTINYNYFCRTLLKEEVPVDDLYAAIGKLEIISITLDPGDNAQLIFESLNSTGMALSEGDKIRNYILMGMSPDEQTRCYEDYWTKIEKATADDVSSFVRDFLSLKQQEIPNINNVYREFKTYAEDLSVPAETILADLLKYARLYEKLLTCKSGLGNSELDASLYRIIKRLEITTVRPFFMDVLRLCFDGEISADDVMNVFLVTESFLVRRNICDVPTNALNKIFVALNRDVLRYDTTANNYVAKLIYSLQARKESSRFPTDREFADALAVKQVYQMRGKYRSYLFERFENYGTIETKDVYAHLDNNDYSIEHIMPQHLTPAWTEALGPDYEEIHETWVHRLANLTLTGYNPNLSNNTFQQKRDAERGGYKSSGLKMNQKIAQKESWGLPELEERNGEMVELAKKIWAYPETDFMPKEKELDSCTLDDEDFDLTNRNIVKFSFLNVEQSVSKWSDMFERVIKFLHQRDKSVLSILAVQDYDIGRYVRSNEKSLRSALQVDDHIYVERNTSTETKIYLLRRLFSLYNLDRTSLTFYLKTDQEGYDEEEEHNDEEYEKEESWSSPEAGEDESLNGSLLYMQGRGGDARGMITDAGFVVLKGSRINPNTTSSCPGSTLRARKEYADKIVDNRLTSNIPFRSPSAAACFVGGASINGKDAWHDAEGRPLNNPGERD